MSRRAVWACSCRERQHLSFVLDDARVRQLVTAADKRGYPVRWQPEAPDFERSEALRPLTQGVAWTAPAGTPAALAHQGARRVLHADPPPLKALRPVPETRWRFMVAGRGVDVVAEVGCPRCGRLVATVLRVETRLGVRHRVNAIRETKDDAVTVQHPAWSTSPVS